MDVKQVLIYFVKRLYATALSVFRRSPSATAFMVTIIFLLSACSMGEEVKRIQAVNEMERERAQSQSTDLTGEQVFIRSCNTCHPRGRQGVGPALDQLSEHFASDEMLKRFIRMGKGVMPANPKETLNDVELDNLVKYLRALPKP
ncbi:MAG TPA: cytochrome c [Candidatus Melainabacteria bacterium]|nr:cytochrome c [Candidatus Melainabacteria bacterium]